ncbi:hypothetical protein PC129_g20401 [Phytophthora cactorum]|uniref:DUF7769 domain-containing protein n=1 Tax=Phytophthora cactorum TaxID=29920 RepID=A0A8T0Y1D8_9STRA|nr:hypothetical protein Pcac1_g11773 [Phytophthora cactorum]KAG2798767.1 hypothetical protein PC111_g20713 [Phytophthora cactorum]KAG2798788.1 hypothetical protein PC112_g21202 [Phytophthora cactorum]KAG2830152.1 hypothetical protein PC113_g21154 [Phytophthora cactorum]KAG2877853.1 hypothetical protein PC114_g23426 [Phytophthora cactorum]
MPSSNTPTTPNLPRTTNLSNTERAQVVSALLDQATGGVLPHGASPAVAAAFGVSARTVRRVWRRIRDNYEHTGVYTSPSSMNSSGRRGLDRSRELEWLRTVDPSIRNTVRTAAHACFLPPTNLFRAIRSGSLRVETSISKPMLSEGNKTKRIAFCVEHVSAATHLFEM